MKEMSRQTEGAEHNKIRIMQLVDETSIVNLPTVPRGTVYDFSYSAYF